MTDDRKKPQRDAMCELAPTNASAARADTGLMATVAFITIVELTSLTGSAPRAAMAALHAALRDALAPDPRSGAPSPRVLSSLTGAIVLVPDDMHADALALLALAMVAIADAKIAVRVGLAHGRVEMIEDADGIVNGVGVCINIAARLAYSKLNQGVVAHASFAELAAGAIDSEHWAYPAPAKAIEIPGKRDEKFTCYAAPSGAFPVLDSGAIASAAIPTDERINAFLLAYDLPKFSEGDARTLASRFRDIVREVGRLRGDGTIPRGAGFSFSPGGDGAILALTGVDSERAYDIATRLERGLVVASMLKAEGAGVEARIGIHYGQVLLYKNAEGRYRPTGATLFDADALAGDDAAKEREGVVVSHALIDVVSHGSAVYRDANFEEIAPLARPHGRQVRRHARRKPKAPAAPEPPRPAPAPNDVDVTRLPRGGAHFVGRGRELERMDAWWADHGVRVVTIVAVGGAGKSALVDRWLQRMQRDDYRGAERVFGWSFYSQGSSDTSAASGDQFIDVALRWLRDPDPTEGSLWDKGARLARLLGERRTLLILDGLEPLQHPPGPMAGRIKDPGVGALVRALSSASGSGLCVISTRVAVEDLASREEAAAPRIELDALARDDGAELLTALGVGGGMEEKGAASDEMKGHALGLTLLGSYLCDVAGGDIRRRREIGPVTNDMSGGDHARRVMDAYARWFGEGPELCVLRMVGLFDRPAERACLEALLAAPTIVGLTDGLIAAAARVPPEVRWKQAVANLRRVRLLAEVGGDGSLDAHPLVREYFGQRLRNDAPKAWLDGHSRLFEVLQKAAPELPETVAAMAPLYAAVVHGCFAGRGQEALDEVLWKRVERVEEFFNWKKLGAFGAELTMLAAFFDPPWGRVAPGLIAPSEAFVLNAAGFVLSAVGRLDDAAAPMRLGLEKRIAQQDWKNAAAVSGNLSELHLARGDVREAVATARQSVELADQSGDASQRIFSRSTLADALCNNANFDEAHRLFEEAEDLQKADEPAYPLLCSLAGFRYCDLLLGEGRIEDVLERARQTLEWMKQQRWLLNIALDHLSLGRAHLLRALRDRDGLFVEARTHLDEAVTGLLRAGHQDHLPRGLLVRADLHLHTGDLPAAERDLTESLTLTTRSGLRLLEADTHLAFTRLHLARTEFPRARESLARAASLIAAAGYHRRPELAVLEARLASA